MSESNDIGCREYNELSRRNFLTGTVKGALLASLPAWLPQVAFARDHVSDRDVIISVYLRGGADGMSLCVPHQDNNYYLARPNVAVPRPGQANGAINLDGFFGLPQAMRGEPTATSNAGAQLIEAYQAKNLLIVHATGSTNPTRSHFDAQRFMEVGKPADPSITTGWLGRHLASVPPLRSDSVLRALDTGDSLQKTLQGAPLALPIPSLRAANPGVLGLSGNTASRPERDAWLRSTYATTDDPIRSTAESTLNTFNLLNTIGFTNYAPGGGAVYPATSFGYSLRSAAALIKAEVGVEAIHIDIGGWDTHNQQGPIDGSMAINMRGLSSGLGALHRDLFSGSTTRNVVVVVVSEFGRTSRENVTLGTDHGRANAMFVLGNSIAGGRVLANWPGVQTGPGQDLQVTIDHRDILAEIVRKRLGNPNVGFVFPDHSPYFHGIARQTRIGKPINDPAAVS